MCDNNMQWLKKVFENSLKQNKNRIFFQKLEELVCLMIRKKIFEKTTTVRNREENKSLFTTSLSEFVMKI